MKEEVNKEADTEGGGEEWEERGIWIEGARKGRKENERGGKGKEKRRIKRRKQ